MGFRLQKRKKHSIADLGGLWPRPPEKQALQNEKVSACNIDGVRHGATRICRCILSYAISIRGR